MTEIIKDQASSFQPDPHGYYGLFGGAFIPEMLYRNVEELRMQYLQHIPDPSFQKDFRDLLRDFVGRPTPLFYAKRLSEKYATQIWL